VSILGKCASWTSEWSGDEHTLTIMSFYAAVYGFSRRCGSKPELLGHMAFQTSFLYLECFGDGSSTVDTNSIVVEIDVCSPSMEDREAKRQSGRLEIDRGRIYSLTRCTLSERQCILCVSLTQNLRGSLDDDAVVSSRSCGVAQQNMENTPGLTANYIYLDI
jgi:hypothetical protein